jgi:hypothetical protein
MYPWIWLKSSRAIDKAAQREQEGVVAPHDEDFEDEQFESDWEHSKENTLTEDEIWKSRPKAVSDGMEDPNMGVRRRVSH